MFPKIRGTFLGAPIIRSIVFWGLYWGPLILGNYHFDLKMKKLFWRGSSLELLQVWACFGESLQREQLNVWVAQRNLNLRNANGFSRML